MAIVENKATEIGDVLVIKTEVPLIGLIALNSFIDDVVGVTGTRLFNKLFRYSTDGFNFSSWTELNNTNLMAIQFLATDIVTFEYRYERVGSDNTGELEFNNINLEGQYVDVTCGSTYSQSLFSPYLSCTDVDVLLWCINVTEKLYKSGIIPKYVERGKNLADDKDYLIFWSSIACFFSLIVQFARRFKNILQEEDILKEYLKQRNLFNCDDTAIEDLVYIANNYYDEIRQRGTIQIAKRKGYKNKQVDGELLRLLCYNALKDEFIFSLVEPHKIGWHINNSSPLYKGTYFQSMSNKSYEDTKDFVDLGLYPKTAGVSIVTDGSKEVARLTAGNRIGNTNYQSFGINIDTNIAYEITFWVKRVGGAGTLTFAVRAADIANNARSTRRVISNAISQSFFANYQLSIQDKWYFVRGIIYPELYSQAQFVNSDLRPTLNPQYDSQHLKWRSNTVKFIPWIESVSGEHYIWDLKIRPVSTPYSTGFVQTNNFINMWLKNNNGRYSNEDVDEILRKYMIPYNSTFASIYL